MAGDNIATDDEMMQCTLHPFTTNNSSIPTGSSGGVCAFCLQDKLGKLVSNSSSISFLPNSPSSSASASASASTFRSRLPSSSSSVSASASRNAFALSRSKSTTHYNNSTDYSYSYSYSTPASAKPKRRGFWSFLHFPHKKTPPVGPGPGPVHTVTQLPAPVQLVVVEEETESSPSDNNANETMSFGRKVTRSRSVGCGSRSFSGDLFDRISTGFGDCALRRVESHRHSTSTVMRDREKPRCGGLFGGFMMIASSSSSTSTTSTSSTYWPPGAENRPLGAQNGRTRGWGWALASPRRVFGSKTGAIVKREIGNGESSTSTTTIISNGANGSDNNSKKTTTTNLGDIPSLLSVRN